MHFRDWKYLDLDSNFIEMCPSLVHLFPIDADNGLMPNWRQATMWTNHCIFNWHIYVVLSLREITHWSLARYVKVLVAHAPGMPGTFSPPMTWKETANWRSRHASRTSGSGEIVLGISGIPCVCATCNFTYLVRGPSWSGDMGSALLEVVSQAYRL